MESSKTQRLLIFLAATLCLILRHSTSHDAYEVLQDYGFPVGLLPKGVLRYDLDTATGKFTAYLNDTCSFSQGNYQLQYKPTFLGYISKGKLSSVQGVSVKLFRVWINVGEVIRRGNAIDISLGVSKAGFPIEYFEEPPHCGLIPTQDLIVNV